MSTSTSLYRGTEWMTDGTCLSEDPDIWDPRVTAVGRGSRDNYRIRAAKALCFECPVLAECLSDSLATGEQHMIRGGVNFASEPERTQAHQGTHPAIVAAYGAGEQVSA